MTNIERKKLLRILQELISYSMVMFCKKEVEKNIVLCSMLKCVFSSCVALRDYIEKEH